MVIDGGEDFDLFDDSKILQINSPRENISGPFDVVYKDTDERWAIVTIKWDGKPRLGIRWFWDSNGMPNGHGYSTWFVGKPLPELAKKCIASWRKFLPDYEIKEWNEQNYNVRKIPYTAQAYDAKKYAFVSDIDKDFDLGRF